MIIFTSLLHHHFPFQHGHSPCKRFFLIKKKKISLDQQLPPCTQFSTSLYYETCKKNGFYLLSPFHLLQFVFGTEAFYHHHCTQTGLVKTISTLANSVCNSHSLSYETNQQHLKEMITLFSPS